LAYTPEVCRRITWAIIVDTRSFFDDIKLSDDFLRGGGRMQFPVSTLDGVYDAIKHGIKIERHNFPCSILSEAGKWFDSLPKLEAYPGGICWLHALSACNFGDTCAYAAGHIAPGDLSDAQVDEAVATLQTGVTTLIARPSSPGGKRKYRSRGGGRGSPGGGPPPHRQM
jgi:hypothetical protein